LKFYFSASRLLKLVDERNEVVDWLDFHRIVEREEDIRVSNSLSSFGTLPGSHGPKPVLSMPSSHTPTPSPKSKDKSKGSSSKEKKEKRNSVRMSEEGKGKEAGGSKFSFFGRKKNKSVKN
jgi:hypothetical protein